MTPKPKATPNRYAPPTAHKNVMGKETHIGKRESPVDFRVFPYTRFAAKNMDPSKPAFEDFGNPSNVLLEFIDRVFRTLFRQRGEVKTPYAI